MNAIKRNHSRKKDASLYKTLDDMDVDDMYLDLLNDELQTLDLNSCRKPPSIQSAFPEKAEQIIHAILDSVSASEINEKYLQNLQEFLNSPSGKRLMDGKVDLKEIVGEFKQYLKNVKPTKTVPKLELLDRRKEAFDGKKTDVGRVKVVKTSFSSKTTISRNSWIKPSQLPSTMGEMKKQNSVQKKCDRGKIEIAPLKLDDELEPTKKVDQKKMSMRSETFQDSKTIQKRPNKPKIVKALTHEQWLEQKRSSKSLHAMPVGNEKSKVTQQLSSKARKPMSFEEWTAIKKQKEAEKMKECNGRGEIASSFLNDSKIAFEEWLRNKKEQEKSLLKNVQDDLLVEEDTKRLEKDERFRAWCRKKTLEQREKRLHDERKLQRTLEMRQKRQEMSVEAFEKWMLEAKNKPRPLPLNGGIRSLCSSTTSVFKNPYPWRSSLEN